MSMVIDPSGVYKGSRFDVDPAEVEEVRHFYCPFIPHVLHRHHPTLVV